MFFPFVPALIGQLVAIRGGGRAGGDVDDVRQTGSLYV